MMKNLLKLKNLYMLIVIAALAYGGYYFGTQNTEDSTSNKTLELTTVSIQKGDLAKKEEYNGTLRQTDKKILNSPTNGVVTFLPKEGSVVNFGEVLFIIDNKPVILLQGSTPFYRTLDLNSDPGVDIQQVEEALVYLGYADSTFVPDEVFDEQTSKMLNTLYIDYGIDTKSEITPTEQVLINQKQDEIELLENTVSDGGTTLSEVNNKKKLLDDAKENATKENAAWQAAENEIERIQNLIDELSYESMSEDTRAGKKAQYEEDIKTQERIQSREAGKESGIDAAEQLAIDNAQKAYDDTLESYNEGVDRDAELAKAREELNELQLSSISETFSPTNAFASKTPIIAGSIINDLGSAVALNSPLYNISSVGIEVVFQVDATDQETVTLGKNVEIELPTDERVPTVITFIDQVVTQTQAGDFIEVVLEVLNPEEVEAYDQAPVKVFLTTEVSENVLYVPVNALLALAEGGYALEVYEGAAEGSTFEGESGVDTTYVAVEIGVFTDGFVEVIGNIQEGQLVVVPR
tara:strand:- start:422 stop:1987 length:1566 start_codon:yes stop_codon:yes gene_type:complete